MSSNMAFNILVDLDSKEAAAKVEELQKELESLKSQRVKAEIDTAEFTVKTREIKEQLDTLGSKHPNIDVRIEATRALAELAAVNKEVDRLDGKKVKVDVDDAGSAEKSKTQLGGLLAAGIALGPAIIPVAAAVAAAIAAIGTGAVVGIAAIGVSALAFHGIADSVKELSTQQQSAGTRAVQSASQQISAANSIASAQDSLANAIENVGVAQAAATLGVRRAKEQEVSASQAVDAAIRHEHDSEVSLADAQRVATRAQADLTQARQDAQRSLEDMANSVQDNALAQRRAAIDLRAAQTGLGNVSEADPRHAAAQLAFDEAKQRADELKTQGDRLVADKAVADAKGVNGSKLVTSAQDALTAANRQVINSQQAVRDSTLAVATAQLHQRDAVDAVTKAEVDGARAVSNAQQSVTQAQRGLENALASQRAQTAATAAANASLLKSYNELSPVGQQFAHFIHDDLNPKLKELQAAAQIGMLPGVESGLRAALPLLPQLNGLIGDVAHTLGGVADSAGHALNTPFWRGFIDYIRSEASPSIRIFGTVMGNLASGGAAILQAFKPVWDQMGQGVQNWSQKFSEASKNLQSNPQFRQFLDYVKQEGPVVAHLIGGLIDAFVHVGQAMGPLGSIVLGVVSGFVGLINAIPTPYLGPMVDVLYVAFLAWKAILIVNVVSEALIAFRATALGATIAQWALNAAMYANPIGIVVLALVVLGATIYEVVRHWQFFKDVAVGAWNGLKDTALGAWENGIKPVFNWIGDGIQHMKDAFNSLPDIVRQAFTAVKVAATDPIRFVIQYVYNDGIVPVWNGISGVFGGPRLPIVPGYATGGVIPGYGPGVDDVPIWASKGEGILVPEAVRALGPDFIHRANRVFGNGRVAGPQGFAAGGIVGDLTSIFTNPLGTLKSLFSGVFDSASKIPGSGGFHDALAHIPDKLIEGLVSKVASLVTSAVGIGPSGPPGAGVARWAGMVDQALGIMRQPLALEGTTLRRMNQESGGNPTIVNTTDSNWAAGTPSVGLMQVIGPTYRANKVIDAGPFLYGVSVDPLANTLASMKYAIGRYGSLPAAYNQAGGYADGGVVTSPTLAMVGEAGPEAVVPLTRPDRARAVMSQAGLSGATIHVGPVHVHSDVDIDQLAHRLAFAGTGAGL